MQKEIEIILKKYGYQFTDGYMISNTIYETVFRKDNEDFVFRQITHRDNL